jgi:hypothetical protein
MEVSGQLHAPTALLTGKEPMAPTGQEAGWTGSDAVVKRKPQPPPGIEPPTTQSTAQRHTTELFWELN